MTNSEAFDEDLRRGAISQKRNKLYCHWQVKTAEPIARFGGDADAKLFREHYNFDPVGLSGQYLLDGIRSYEDLVSGVVDRLPRVDLKRGYADDVRKPLEEIDELLDRIYDLYKRSTAGGNLNVQTAVDGLRRWKDTTYKLLTRTVGEEEAAEIYAISDDVSFEEHFAACITFLRDLKDDIQKYPHHVIPSTTVNMTGPSSALAPNRAPAADGARESPENALKAKAPETPWQAVLDLVWSLPRWLRVASVVILCLVLGAFALWATLPDPVKEAAIHSLLAPTPTTASRELASPSTTTANTTTVSATSRRDVPSVTTEDTSTTREIAHTPTIGSTATTTMDERSARNPVARPTPAPKVIIGSDGLTQITMELNTARPYSDYTSVKDTTYEKCAEACLADPNCLAYDFDGIPSSWGYKTCWLKNPAPAPTRRVGIVSGAKSKRQRRIGS